MFQDFEVVVNMEDVAEVLVFWVIIGHSGMHNL